MRRISTSRSISETTTGVIRRLVNIETSSSARKLSGLATASSRPSPSSRKEIGTTPRRRASGIGSSAAAAGSTWISASVRCSTPKRLAIATAS